MMKAEEQRLETEPSTVRFEADSYLDKLVDLRRMRPAIFYAYLQAVIEIVEQYERERDGSRKGA